jgi:hypothetical protein
MPDIHVTDVKVQVSFFTLIHLVLTSCAINYLNNFIKLRSICVYFRQKTYRTKQYRSIIIIIIIIIINDKIYDRITKALQWKWICKNSYTFEIVKDYTHIAAILTNKSELRPEIEKNNYKYKYSI